MSLPYHGPKKPASVTPNEPTEEQKKFILECLQQQSSDIDFTQLPGLNQSCYRDFLSRLKHMNANGHVPESYQKNAENLPSQLEEHHQWPRLRVN